MQLMTPAKYRYHAMYLFERLNVRLKLLRHEEIRPMPDRIPFPKQYVQRRGVFDACKEVTTPPNRKIAMSESGYHITKK